MNNLFQQGGIPVPTPRPYAPNPTPMVQAPQQAQQRPMGGLFGALNGGLQNPGLQNLMIAAGTAMANKGQGFGQTLAGLQGQAQEQAQKKQAANLTAQWLETRGADPVLVQMAQQGMGGQALQMFQASQREPQTPKTIKAADGYNYWLDGENAGKRVFPDVAKEEVNGIQIGPDGQLVVGGKQDEKNRANQILDNQTAASSATELKSTIAGMRKAIDGAGYMGPGAGLYDTIDSALEAAGSPLSLPGNSGSRSVLKSGGMKFVLDQVQQTKGAISNKEMELFQAASPGLQTTKEGALILLDIAERVADRQIERTQAMEQYRAQYGTLDGFEGQWAQYAAQNPIITDDLFAGQAPAAPTGDWQDLGNGIRIREKQ